VSLGRLQGFLNQVCNFSASLKLLTHETIKTALLDEFERQKPHPEFHNPETSQIGFANASFSWVHPRWNNVITPSPRSFCLSIDGELVFERGAVNIIVGPTGSGKTSLLMALLGEMHYVPLAQGAWVNLPKGGGVAYASQESWVLNETIKAYPYCLPLEY
jgi:ABC-type multidrug transport system fused ATPase/permease subunit